MNQSPGGSAKSPGSMYRDRTIDFVAGFLGGITQTIVTQPLDTLKVKLQTYPYLYKGITDCFLKTIDNQNFLRSLYAGTTPALVANIAESSVLFAAYGGCQQLVARSNDVKDLSELTAVQNGFAGLMASVFSTFVLCPTELVKCKLQVLQERKCSKGESEKGKTTWTVCHSIWRTQGIAGFFRGLVPTFWRELPGYFVFFTAYEGCREFLRAPGQSKDDIGPLRIMLSGAISGILLWTAVFPADVIKSRMQVANIDGGMFKYGAHLIKTEGFLSMYSGLRIAIIRTAPATATLFLTVEYTKRLLHLSDRF